MTANRRDGPCPGDGWRNGSHNHSIQRTIAEAALHALAIAALVLSLLLWVRDDPATGAHAQVLSRVYCAIMDALKSDQVKLAT